MSNRASAVKAIGKWSTELEFMELANLIVEQEISNSVEKTLLESCFKYSSVSDELCVLMNQLVSRAD